MSTHEVLDLLPDRSAESAAAWLRYSRLNSCTWTSASVSEKVKCTGVRPSPEDLRQDLRAITKKIRPDWDPATPGLRENWEGDKTSHYPYKERK